jgi:hypothetical protein
MAEVAHPMFAVKWQRNVANMPTRCSTAKWAASAMSHKSNIIINTSARLREHSTNHSINHFIFLAKGARSPLKASVVHALNTKVPVLKAYAA